MMDEHAPPYHDGAAPQAGSEEGAQAGGSRAWMFTFTDMVLLLLTFFVMMFAMSSPRPDAFERLTEGLSTRLAPVAERATEQTSPAHSIDAVFERPAVNLHYLRAVIAQAREQDGTLDGVMLHEGRDRLTLSVPSALLFPSGRADLRGGGAALLRELGGILSRIGNRVAVAGHTDPAPVTGGPFPSNWELSLARAATVARALREAGYPDPVTVLGYADTRFPKGGAGPDPARYEQARRVDIVILPGAKE